jgi:tRNA (guanine-N7-)-methyltransferase
VNAGGTVVTRVRVGRGIEVPPPYAVDEVLRAAAGWPGVFGREAPLVVEVGFGNGQFLVDLARARPEADFVGIELYGKGIVKLARRLEREAIANVRIVKGDAIKVLAERFGRGQIAQVHVNFPDPWPKTRHHKRRLVGPAFPAVLFARLAPGGDVFLATDHEGYAHQMMEVFEAHPGFTNAEGAFRFIYHVPGRVPTKYERKFGALGATIRHLHYRRLG